jgi:SAM-dependent methyltransferase
MFETSHSLEDSVTRILVCPTCHSSLTLNAGVLLCASETCGFKGSVADGVVVLEDRANVSFFDKRHEIMEQSNSGEGVRSVFYDQQAAYLAPILQPGMTVLDAGCGPALVYPKPAGCFVIGLDPSFESIRANRAVDLQVFGTAGALPIPDQSVDAILCFYSVHHMVGGTVKENQATAARALSEFGRVVKPGGSVLVFEVNPWRPFWLFEQVAWNKVRQMLGAKLDMYFYSDSALARLGRRIFPQARLNRVVFRSSPLEWFPPVFSIQWLKIPRMLYPFQASVFHWQF